MLFMVFLLLLFLFRRKIIVPILGPIRFFLFEAVLWTFLTAYYLNLKMFFPVNYLLAAVAAIAVWDAVRSYRVLSSEAKNGQ